MLLSYSKFSLTHSNFPEFALFAAGAQRILVLVKRDVDFARTVYPSETDQRDPEHRRDEDLVGRRFAVKPDDGQEYGRKQVVSSKLCFYTVDDSCDRPNIQSIGPRHWKIEYESK